MFGLRNRFADIKEFIYNVVKFHAIIAVLVPAKQEEFKKYNKLSGQAKQHDTRDENEKAVDRKPACPCDWNTSEVVYTYQQVRMISALRRGIVDGIIGRPPPITLFRISAISIQ